MKLFHLSDLHIGLSLLNRDLREDQEYILQQIIDCAAEELPDVVMIAGDIYDKAVPSAEAVSVFDRFIQTLSETLPQATIVAISGNHDSAPRIDCYREILSRQRIHMIGLPPRTEDEHIEKVIIEDEHGPVAFYLLPFVRPSMVKAIVGTDEKGNNLSYDASIHRLIEREDIDTSMRNVLVSHQFYLPSGNTADEVERTDSEIRTVGNIDVVHADILERFDYAALGHIHKPMKVGSEFFRYCGTPLACSVSEAGQQKGIISVELGAKGDVTTTVIPLVSLRQVRVVKGTFQEVLTKPSEDYVSVILTDSEEIESLDMQDRIRNAYPNLLEIRRDVQRKLNYEAEIRENSAEKMDPYELCQAFLGTTDEEELALLEDIIHTVMGVK